MAKFDFSEIFKDRITYQKATMAWKIFTFTLDRIIKTIHFGIIQLVIALCCTYQKQAMSLSKVGKIIWKGYIKSQNIRRSALNFRFLVIICIWYCVQKYLWVFIVFLLFSFWAKNRKIGVKLQNILISWTNIFMIVYTINFVYLVKIKCFYSIYVWKWFSLCILKVMLSLAGQPLIGKTNSGTVMKVDLVKVFLSYFRNFYTS